MMVTDISLTAQLTALSSIGKSGNVTSTKLLKQRRNVLQVLSSAAVTCWKILLDNRHWSFI
jgi:hypothetical protein